MHQYAETALASVRPDFRGQGLATELFRRSFGIFKENGDSVIKCMATSPFTRKLAASLNFEELGCWKFSEAKDDDGNPLFPNLSESDDGVAALSVLKLYKSKL